MMGFLMGFLHKLVWGQLIDRCIDIFHINGFLMDYLQVTKTHETFIEKLRPVLKFKIR